jgi:hypothetical protein
MSKDRASADGSKTRAIEGDLHTSFYDELSDASNRPTVDAVSSEISVQSIPGKRVIAEELIRGIDTRVYKDIRLSVDEVEGLIEALVLLRVCQVRGARTPIDFRVVEYPAILFPILRSIGDLENVEEGFKFKVVSPFLKIDDKGRYQCKKKADFWSEIEDKLGLLVSFGRSAALEIAKGLPKDRTGVLEVLSFLHIEGRLHSPHGPSKVSPLESLIGSVISVKLMETVFAPPRWDYGSIKFILSGMRGVVQRSFRL